MKPRLCLRAASICIGLFACGHTFGHVMLTYGSPEERAISAAKKTFQFEWMGSDRSVWDFYVGMSLILILTLFFLAVLAWILGNLSATSLQQARPLVWLLAVMGCLLSIVCWLKFFFVASLLSTLTAILLVISVVGLFRSRSLTQKA